MSMKWRGLLLGGILQRIFAFNLLFAAVVFAADTRPYEFVRANRTTDEITPWIDFEAETGWTGTATGGSVDVVRSQAHQLFGDWTLAVLLNAAEARVKPSAPLSLPIADFTTCGVWVRGVRRNYGAGQPKYPELLLAFADGSGRERLVATAPTEWDAVPRVDWGDWHWIVRRFSEAERAELAKLRFNGFVFRGCTNDAPVTFYLDNVSFFRDDISGTVGIRPLDVSKLDFPTRLEGAMPESSAKGAVNAVVTNGTQIVLSYEGDDGRLVYVWDRASDSPDALTAQWNGGRPFRPMRLGGTVGPGKAEWSLSIRGKTLVMDVTAPAEAVTEVHCGFSPTAEKRLKVPMYPTEFNWRGLDARIQLTDGVFSYAFADWYRSGASKIEMRWAGDDFESPKRQARETAARPADLGPFGTPPPVRKHAVSAGYEVCDYLPKTDGRRNEVHERLYLTVSPTFDEVLPTIANPVSPWKHVTGTSAWYAYASTADRERDRRIWRQVRGLGIRNVVLNDHEVCFRDGGESFTFRLDPAPGKGGEQGLRDWARFLIDELGYRYGPYNNFTDFAPINANWSINRAGREPDGSLTRAWMRCYSPKPLYGLEMCRRYTPVLKERYGFNTAYCDVHTAAAPWERTDYDARTPGAGRFATTYYAYGAILEEQRRTWNGPVYSEGTRQYLYAGLVDGNYAQSRINPEKDPWIVDFNLLRIHPLECDFGMGNLEMFNGARRPFGTDDSRLDFFIAAELAFGNAPYLAADFLWTPTANHGPAYNPKAVFDFAKGAPLVMRSYFMPLALASRYTQARAKAIRYANAHGEPETTSDAIRSGAINRNQVIVEYEDGTCVAVNGSLAERMLTNWNWGWRIDLSPTGYCGWTKDGKVMVVSTDDGRGRFDYCASDDYVFLDARGVHRELPRAKGDGTAVRYRENGEWKTVTLRGHVEFTDLPVKKPVFHVPPSLYAMPGVECNVYFENILDSNVPRNYSCHGESKVGQSFDSRWAFTPKASDAGKDYEVRFTAYDDSGLVAEATTVVKVAPEKTAAAKAERRTMALLGDSLTNCRYQDRLETDLKAAGFVNFTPVGSHGLMACTNVVGVTPHDGYGGYTFWAFLDHYEIADDELQLLEKEAERDQLKHLGVKLGKGEGWRRHTMKSPLVRIVDGRKTVDVQAWLDRINGGQAPDYIVIQLGGNGMSENPAASYFWNAGNAKLLHEKLRAAAPEATIAFCYYPCGSRGEHGYGTNNGAAPGRSGMAYRHKAFHLNRELERLVRNLGDPKTVMVPFGSAIDPDGGYIRKLVPENACSDRKTLRCTNAVHPGETGGRQLGDALAAWLANVW